MSYVWKQNLLSSSKYSVKCPYTLSPEYICIHDTANSASAANEINYMISNNNQVSFHVAVDEKEAIQAEIDSLEKDLYESLKPENDNGDYKYFYSPQQIIEICEDRKYEHAFDEGGLSLKCRFNSVRFIIALPKLSSYSIGENSLQHGDLVISGISLILFIN